jgi:hypothetical protein
MVKGFRTLPGVGAGGCRETGVRKASREETAGKFAPAVVSDYRDLVHRRFLVIDPVDPRALLPLFPTCSRPIRAGA